MPRIVAISDVHGQWSHLPPPPAGDILIVAGDFSANGGFVNVLMCMDAVARLNFKHRIVIAGNHDCCVEDMGKRAFRDHLPPGIIYLEDEEVTVEGLRIYGTPWTPNFNNWSFMGDDLTELPLRFADIPKKLDILVSHGPPHRVRDFTETGDHVGSRALRDAIADKKPRKVVFGHIHEGWSGGSFVRSADGRIKFYNVAALNADYHQHRDPWTSFDVKPRKESLAHG